MLRKYNKTLTVALTTIALATASLAATSDAFAGGGGKGGAAGRVAAAVGAIIIITALVGSMWAVAEPVGCGCVVPWSTSAIDLAPHGTPARCLCNRAGVLCAYSRQAWVVRLSSFVRVRSRKSLDGNAV
jgi:hypothetical protein